MKLLFQNLPAGTEFTLEISMHDKLPFSGKEKPEEMVYFKLDEILFTQDGNKINALEKISGIGTFIGNWEVTIKKIEIPKHWHLISMSLKEFMPKIADESLYVLLKKLLRDYKYPPDRIKNMDQYLRNALLDAVVIEILERREEGFPCIQN